ncbi:MAG: hypothetical protein OEZ33_11870 [Gammaproteobacteria bacterium]|nr:hypothetical protein [Gammaproteobacteria bacterium]MDH5778904.1 hypothetical protein [Gammaproteobacteria bacterium]
MRLTLFSSLFFFSALVQAGPAEIVAVEMEQQSGTWTAHVTLKHGDTGWKHYADGWRIINIKGKVLGHRTLHHPHVSEQPFTRSLSNIEIPPKTKIVFVEAHDKVHGWNNNRVKVNLTRPKGDRYKIRK